MSAMNHYKDIEYTLKKSDRKTTSIYIERDGSVSVLAPQPFDQSKINSILEKKRSWIYKNLAEWSDLNRTQIQRQYVNGESFLYLGRSYRLKLVDKQNVPLKLYQGYFCLSRDSFTKADVHFKSFYKKKLAEKLIESIDHFAANLGVKPKSIKVMELQNRWGSCTQQGVINFHWKCAMLSLSVLDYVIVHELSHLIDANHTPNFWRTVEKVLPNYQEQKQWLKFNGASLNIIS